MKQDRDIDIKRLVALIRMKPSSDEESAEILIEIEEVLGESNIAKAFYRQFTLLHFAVTQSNDADHSLAVVRLFLKYGANLNQAAVDKVKPTPLHSAVRRLLPKMTELLLGRGANITVRDYDLKTQTPNKTPLNYAQSKHFLDSGMADRQLKILELLENEMTSRASSSSLFNFGVGTFIMSFIPSNLYKMT
jgi:ankyrin repeat protein